MHYLLNWMGGCFYLTVYTSGNRFTFTMKRMLIFLSSCYFPNGLHNVLLGKLSVRFFQYGLRVPQRSFSILLSGLLQLTDVWSEEWNRLPTATLIWPRGVSLLGFACQSAWFLDLEEPSVQGTVQFRDQCRSSPVILTYSGSKKFSWLATMTTFNIFTVFDFFI